MKPIIIANWKCNPTSQKEAMRLFNSLKTGLKNNRSISEKAEVVICPPFVYLSSFKFKGVSFKLGAQDCFWEEKGAHTGEISPLMLKDLGCSYVIVGHSERRAMGESDEMVCLKIKEVLDTNLFPVFCIGENEEQRKKGKTFSFLEKQIKQGLKDIPRTKIEKIVFAYEPIWAIGTGNPCSEDEAFTVSLFVRKLISKIAGNKIAKKIRIIYGGSVNSQNAKDYFSQGGISGFLVGGASLKSKEFLKIINLST